jgi:hypothetical protein
MIKIFVIKVDIEVGNRDKNSTIGVEIRDSPSFDSLTIVVDGNRRNGTKRAITNTQASEMGFWFHGTSILMLLP